MFFIIFFESELVSANSEWHGNHESVLTVSSLLCTQNKYLCLNINLVSECQTCQYVLNNTWRQLNLVKVAFKCNVNMQSSNFTFLIHNTHIEV